MKNARENRARVRSENLMIFETDRLILRPWKIEDAEEVQETVDAIEE